MSVALPEKSLILERFACRDVKGKSGFVNRGFRGQCITVVTCEYNGRSTGSSERPPFFFGRASAANRSHMSIPTFWQSCLESFQRELTPQQFNTWIRPLRLEFAGEGLRLIAPNRFVLQWVKDRFAGRIEELAAVAVGRPLRLAFSVADAGEATAPLAPAPSVPQPAPAVRRGEQASLNPG